MAEAKKNHSDIRPSQVRYSASQLGSATSCGERYRNAYVERKPRTTSNLAMRRGSALHHAVETDLKHRQKGGDPLLVDELIKVAESTLVESVDDGVVDLESDPELVESKAKVAALTTGYHEFISPTIGEILEVEPYWQGEITYGEKTYHLHGYPDAIDIDPATGEIRIRDWKTGKSFSRATYENGFQMPMYSVLAKANGYETERVRIDHLRVLKSGPKHEALDLVRGSAHHLQLARMVAVVDAMHHGSVFVPNPTGWMCNKGCDYWTDCPFRAPDIELKGTAE